MNEGENFDCNLIALKAPCLNSLSVIILKEEEMTVFLR